MIKQGQEEKKKEKAKEGQTPLSHSLSRLLAPVSALCNPPPKRKDGKWENLCFYFILFYFSFPYL